MPIATTKYHKNNSMQVYQLSNLAKYTHELLVIFTLQIHLFFVRLCLPWYIWKISLPDRKSVV